MKKITDNSIIKIETSGLNFERFLNNLIQNNITISNVKKEDNIVVFETSKNNLQILKKCDKYREYKVIKTNGLAHFIESIKKRIAIFIGIIIAIILFFASQTFTFSINIMGVETINRELIYEKLKAFGVEKYTVVHRANSEIEDYLQNEIEQISIVSVNKVGTTILINIKEKLGNVQEEKANLIAPENMLITNIEVFSGTTNVKVGDVVKKGDVLVYAYMYDGAGEIVNCEPVANIDADCWFTHTYNFKNTQIEKHKTGKTQIVANYFLGKTPLTSNKKECKFEMFDEYEKTYYISSFLLPIKVKKMIYSELEEIEVSHNFEEEKEKIISSCYENALNKVPQNYVVINEDVVITPTSDGFIVAVYLKSNIEIRSSNDKN